MDLRLLLLEGKHVTLEIFLHFLESAALGQWFSLSFTLLLEHSLLDLILIHGTDGDGSLLLQAMFEEQPLQQGVGVALRLRKLQSLRDRDHEQ